MDAAGQKRSARSWVLLGSDLHTPSGVCPQKGGTLGARTAATLSSYARGQVGSAALGRANR